MAGKGSRQRTYGEKYESNWDRIFNKAEKAPERPVERNYRDGSTKGRGK